MLKVERELVCGVRAALTIVAAALLATQPLAALTATPATETFAVITLAAAAIVMFTVVPVIRYRTRNGNTILNLAEAPAVAAALLHPVPIAVTAGVIAITALAFAEPDLPRSRRLAHIIVDAPSTFAAIAVCATVGAPDGSTWLRSGATAGFTGGALSLAAMYAIVTFTAQSEPAHHWRRTFIEGQLVAVAAGTLGAVIAVTATTHPTAATVVTAAVAATAIISWQRTRALEHADRWERLANLATATHSHATEDAIYTAAITALERTTGSHIPRIHTTEPTDAAATAELGPDRWIAYHPAGPRVPLTDTDRAQLAAAARTASVALENLRLRTALERAATTDTLTGIANRARFEDEHRRINARAHRSDGTPYTLTVVDLNNFKAINDTYGHAVGDDVLKHVAATLEYAIREGDLVARLGGDEFVILSADTTDTDALTERIHTHLHDHPTPYPKVTAAIGTAVYGNDGTTLTELFAAADRRMYDDKAHTTP